MDILGVSLNTILMWALFGFLVGIVVHLIDRGEVRGGVVGTVLLGIVGALVGGYLAQSILGIQVSFDIQGFLIAIAGGLLLALLSRLVFREGNRIRTMTKEFGR